MSINEAIINILIAEHEKSFTKNIEVDGNEFDCRYEVLAGNGVIDISCSVRITGNIYDERFEDVLVSIDELFVNLIAYDYDINVFHTSKIEELFINKIKQQNENFK